MSKYFTEFPIIEYQGVVARDLTRRSRVREKLLNDPYVFLPYTVREGEKPETIAQLYYGSVNDTWLVLLANNITDPYHQWPLDTKEFNDAFISKYSIISKREGFNVIRWGQDNTRTDNIVYYYVKDEITDRIKRYSVETSPLPFGSKAVRVYDYENQINENKREISLIDKVYRNQVVEEFRSSIRS
jgi:hypothetical protein